MWDSRTAKKTCTHTAIWAECSRTSLKRSRTIAYPRNVPSGGINAALLYFLGTKQLEQFSFVKYETITHFSSLQSKQLQWWIHLHLALLAKANNASILLWIFLTWEAVKVKSPVHITGRHWALEGLPRARITVESGPNSAAFSHCILAQIF